MFSIILASAMATSFDGPGFRFELHGRPGSTVAVTATAPRGWLPSFCSSRVCSTGHTRVTIPATGTATLDLHMHNIANGAHGMGKIAAEGKSVSIRI